MNTSEFNDRVLSYFTGDARAEAIGLLGAYLEPGAFTGPSYERIPVTDHYTITPGDIVAVSMLSVDVPARCSEWILGAGQPLIRHLLEKIPVDADIASFGSLNDKNGPAWQLWDQLISFSDMGSTKTSKLLARKRSRLIPIRDSVVSAALGIERSDNDWQLWQEFMKGPGIGDFRNSANEIGARHLSDLRVLDIVIWMKEQGWKYVSSDSSVRE